MTRLIKYLALALCLASVGLADSFTGEPEQPPIDPFVGEKVELFRFSRDLKSPRQIAKYTQQRQEQLVENGQVSRQQQQVGTQNEQQQQQQVANELPAFNDNATPAEVATVSQAADANEGPRQKTSSVSATSSSASEKSGSLSKTITTTTTTTTTTQNNQDQPQVAQIKEIRVHTVPLSEAVHYANYVVVPTSGSRAARLEESSSSSSSSHKSSSSTSSETEQVAVAPTVVVDPPPAAVAPDCVLHRLVVERPVSSQLVVNVAPEVRVSHSSSSSRSSKIVSESAVAPPESTVYSVRRVFYPPVYSAKVVQVPAPVPAPAVKEEHFRSESRSSREESHGLGHVMSSSSSSSSSRSSKSSTTTTSQTAALIAPPPPPPPPMIRTVTTVVRPAAPLLAVKAAPLVEVSSGQTSDVSVNHHQSGPNYNYGYSIKQHSSEPGTKGVVVGDRVVYLK